MTEHLFSSSWQRISGVRPRIPSHVRIHRHTYRGDTWYVIQDRKTGRTHRFAPPSYAIIAMMDGQRTVHALWEEALLRLGEEAPTQEEFIQLLSQLYVADVLQTDVTPDVEELMQRQQRQRDTTSRQRWRSPLAIRIPLFDPDRMLARLVPLLSPLLGRGGVLLWLAVVVTGIVLAGMHWRELTENIADRVLLPSNLLLLGVIYPVVKACHEIGHGVAAKKWGAEVHDIGLMLLVFFPVPYVDASMSASFANRWHRVVVGSAGMIVEVFLASVAVIVWVVVEPGLVSAIAYNVILIGGVSTLLVNGNPLLRFDGYYVLSDLLEIPNLGARGNQQCAYLVQRHLLRLTDARTAAVARGEAFWLPTYAVASFCYRVLVVCAIALFVAGQYFFIGVLLGAWALISAFLLPLFRMFQFLATSPRLRATRGRSALASLAALATIGLLLAIPLPSWTNSEGVVWLPDSAFVRAEADGFVSQVVQPSGARVNAGEVLIATHDEELDAEFRMLDARIRELELTWQRNRVTDLVEADIVAKQVAALREERELTQTRLQGLTIRSKAAGTFVVPAAGDLAGRFVRRGDTLGYVIPDAPPIVRAFVSQARVGLVRAHTAKVGLLLANTVGEELQGQIVREVPEATTELPSAALGMAGGGNVAVDPRAGTGAQSYLSHFVFDVSIDGSMQTDWYGQRVYLRFEHGLEPLALQWYRLLRQLFLSRFDV